MRRRPATATPNAGSRVRGPAKRGSWPWAAFGVADPRQWLLQCDEPAARWVTLTGVHDRPADDPDVVEAHRAVVSDAGTRALLDRIPDWTAGDRFGGHDSPKFAPNLVALLFDHGVDAGDDPRIGHLLDQMLDRQNAEGRFESYTARRSDEPPVWGALLCDSHAILDVLVRAGRADHPRVQTGLRRPPTWSGFASLSFGQKKCPSGFATARILAVLHRLDDLAVDAASVDVTALGSSKGGAGTALPPAAFR